jgi:hypothetical protein
MVRRAVPIAVEFRPYGSPSFSRDLPAISSAIRAIEYCVRLEGSGELRSRFSSLFSVQSERSHRRTRVTSVENRVVIGSAETLARRAYCVARACSAGRRRSPAKLPLGDEEGLVMREMRTSRDNGKSTTHGARHEHERLDDDASLAYANVSTKVVRSVVVSRARAALPSRFRFCEIAAGPSAWSFVLLEEFSDAHGIVVCAPNDLAELVARRSAGGYEGRLEVVPIGLPALADLQCDTFDLSLTLDGVLDAADEPAWILTHLVRITKPGGLVMSLVRNLCDAVSASLAEACIQQAEQALTGKGRCMPNTEELNLFTAQSIEDLVRAGGARPWATLGVPAAAPQRSLESHGHHASSVSSMLSDGDSLERILRIEQALLDQRGGTTRGSHLLSLAVVPSRGTSWGDFWLSEIEGGSRA